MTTQTTDARITADELSGWLADDHDCRILDVRSPAEFEGAHIPGAYNVPLDVLGEHTVELHRHVDVPLVVVCRSGMRAGHAGRTLAAAGMANTCAMGALLSRLPYNQAASCDVDRVVRELTAARPEAA